MYCSFKLRILESRETAKSSRSRPWVKTIVDRSQPGFEHVRVDLGRRQIAVAEHHLDSAQIGAALQQMRREGVPQDVGTQRARKVGAAPVVFQNFPESDARQRS